MPGSTKIRAVVALLVCLAVLTLSFLPLHEKSFFHTRGHHHSWGHFVAFAAIAFLLMANARSRFLQMTLLGVAVGFGLFLEVGQHLLYSSPFEGHDVVVDTLGALLGAFTLWSLQFSHAILRPRSGR